MSRKLPFIFHNLQDSQVFALAQQAGKLGYDVQGFIKDIEEAPWVKQSQYISRYAPTPNLGEINAGSYALNIKKSGLEGVFVPLVDDIAEMLAEYAPLLRKYGMRFLTVHPTILEQSNTYYLQQYQGKLNIPRTAYCNGDALLQTAIDIGFPIILKSFRFGFIRFDTSSDMQKWLNNQEDYPLHLVQRVQQYIPGAIRNMATALLLFDKESRPVRGFTARRIRVAETMYGSFGETVAAQAEWIPELYDAAANLLSQLGWVGFAEVECKQDEKGAWHLLEINPRLSGWSCFAEADGAGLLPAYYHLNTEDKALEPACLQRSTTTYSRMIASTMHEPDWENFNHQTYKAMLTFPENTCFGAWDKDDPQANRAWVSLMLQRVKQRRLTLPQ